MNWIIFGKLYLRTIFFYNQHDLCILKRVSTRCTLRRAIEITVGENKLSEQVEADSIQLFNWWLHVKPDNFSNFGQQDKRGKEIFSKMMKGLNDKQVLTTDENVVKFFQTCLNYCVNNTYEKFTNSNSDIVTFSSVEHNMMLLKNNPQLDGFTELAVQMMMAYVQGKTEIEDSNSQAVQQNALYKLLPTVLGVIIGSIKKDDKEKGKKFYQMPYQRILNQMFTNLTSRVPSGGNRSFRFSILRSFVEAYHYLRPPKVPGFAYAWMELIGHRVFINAVMINENRNCWKNYASGVENEK